MLFILIYPNQVLKETYRLDSLLASWKNNNNQIIVLLGLNQAWVTENLNMHGKI